MFSDTLQFKCSSLTVAEPFGPLVLMAALSSRMIYSQHRKLHASNMSLVSCALFFCLAVLAIWVQSYTALYSIVAKQKPPTLKRSVTNLLTHPNPKDILRGDPLAVFGQSWARVSSLCQSKVALS